MRDENEGQEVKWEWPGDDYVWECIRVALERAAKAGPGDWRVSWKLHVFKSSRAMACFAAGLLTSY